MGRPTPTYETWRLLGNQRSLEDTYIACLTYPTADQSTMEQKSDLVYKLKSLSFVLKHGKQSMTFTAMPFNPFKAYLNKDTNIQGYFYEPSLDGTYKLLRIAPLNSIKPLPVTPVKTIFDGPHTRTEIAIQKLNLPYKVYVVRMDVKPTHIQQVDITKLTPRIVHSHKVISAYNNLLSAWAEGSDLTDSAEYLSSVIKSAQPALKYNNIPLLNPVSKTYKYKEYIFPAYEAQTYMAGSKVGVYLKPDISSIYVIGIKNTGDEYQNLIHIFNNRNIAVINKKLILDK